jgi:hypothetical protein
MKSHKAEVVLTEDGALTLRNIPFHCGDCVEVVVRKLPKEIAHPNGNRYPYHGIVIQYQDPTEPVALDDWEATQ